MPRRWFLLRYRSRDEEEQGKFHNHQPLNKLRRNERGNYDVDSHTQAEGARASVGVLEVIRGFNMYLKIRYIF